MTDYSDSTLTPAPPYGEGSGMGVSPYPLSGDAETQPTTPCGNADHLGQSPYPIDSSDDLSPKADRHDGSMDLHPGQPKPGSFA